MQLGGAQVEDRQAACGPTEEITRGLGVAHRRSTGSLTGKGERGRDAVVGRGEGLPGGVCGLGDSELKGLAVDDDRACSANEANERVDLEVANRCARTCREEDPAPGDRPSGGRRLGARRQGEQGRREHPILNRRERARDRQRLIGDREAWHAPSGPEVPGELTEQGSARRVSGDERRR